MAGMSYFAVIQYLAAAQRPPHLRAIFPYLGWTDLYRHAMYHGGAVQSDFLSFYLSLVGVTQRLSVPPTVRHLLDHRWLQRLGTRVFLPLRPLLASRLHPEEGWVRGFVAVAFDQRYDGPFYRERSAGPVLDRIEVPVCLGTHWGNPGLHMRGAFEAWARLRSPKKLFIGPPEAD
jgi:predicted acyl esterase